MLFGGPPKKNCASELDIPLSDSSDALTNTVSCIAWASQQILPTFATSDWDACIRIWNVNSGPDALALKDCFDAKSPCLSVNWHQDETKLFTGCIDGTIQAFDIASGKSEVIGYHQNAVKNVYWLQDSNALVSVSFDETVRFWDPREGGHVAGFILEYKPFCSDLLFPYLALGCSDLKTMVVDLRDAQRILGNETVRLQKYMKPNFSSHPHSQISCIKLVHFGNERLSVIVGTNDGRCNVSTISPEADKLDSLLTFKAHKSETSPQTVYSVNSVGFHPIMGRDLCYTGGGNGTMLFWDTTRKKWLTRFDFKGKPVTQCVMDPSGKYMAYALGCDWARGLHSDTSQPPKVFVHRVQDRELDGATAADNPVEYP